jgi:hypothetical protein
VTITGVLVARTVRKKLGRDGLREVLANLWPGDCQTCGQSLDTGETALVVDDMIVTADASLHHPGCRDTGWNDTGIITGSGDPLITHITQLLMLGMRLPSGAVEHRPALLVNPGLEQLRLRPTKKGWRVAAAEFYTQHFGMLPADQGPPDAPVPDTRAFVLGNEVAVQCGPLSWMSSADPTSAQAVRDSGGLMVLISTALHPARLDNGALTDAVQAGHVVSGWANLADSADTPTADVMDRSRSCRHPVVDCR